MELDCVENRDVQALMQEPVPSTNTPERRGSQHIRRTLPSVLDYSITSSDVMQREIAERMD